VWKTTSSGAAWTPAGLAGKQVLQLALDPQDPRVLLASTLYDGLYRSADAGASWTKVVAGLDRLDVTALVVDPAAPATVYAGTTFLGPGYDPGGVMKSTDGGGTWASTTPGLAFNVRAIALDPSAPATLYIGIDYLTGGSLFKTTNGGLSWTQPNTGLPTVFINALAIDPQRPATVYAATGQGLFKTTDAAGHWAMVDTVAPVVMTAVATDPTTPDVVYLAGGGGLFRSPDAGATGRTPTADCPARTSPRSSSIPRTRMSCTWAPEPASSSRPTPGGPGRRRAPTSRTMP
jgi:photosystem II stability/assembly factor-like uncharacterized protein